MSRSFRDARARRRAGACGGVDVERADRRSRVARPAERRHPRRCLRHRPLARRASRPGPGHRERRGLHRAGRKALGRDRKALPRVRPGWRQRGSRRPIATIAGHDRGGATTCARGIDRREGRRAAPTRISPQSPVAVNRIRESSVAARVPASGAGAVSSNHSAAIPWTTDQAFTCAPWRRAGSRMPSAPTESRDRPGRLKGVSARRSATPACRNSVASAPDIRRRSPR